MVNKPKSNNGAKPEKPLIVTMKLFGEDAEKLRLYMRSEYIKAAATAGYKLMYERLDQLKLKKSAAGV